MPDYRKKKWWIKTIHTLKAKANIDEDNYRMMMDGLYGKSSSTKLNYSEAMDFVDRLKALAEGKPQPPLEERGVWITPAQRRKIEALAVSLHMVDEKRMLDKKRLFGFIEHQLGEAKSLDMLRITEASKVIVGLERIFNDKQRKEQEKYENDRQHQLDGNQRPVG